MKILLKKMFCKFLLSLLLFLSLANISVSFAQAKNPTEGKKKNLVVANGPSDSCLTVYNQNRAIVRQNRRFYLETGLNHLYWDSLPSTIDIHSVNLSAVNPDAPIIVKEQDYQIVSHDRNSILADSLGKTVHLRQFLANGKIEEHTGILVIASPTDKQVFDYDASILNQRSQIEINNLPPNLTSMPILDFLVEAETSGQRELALTYQANNINWQCDYIVILNATQDKFDISGLATIENRCGIGFVNTRLKLMAGSIENARPRMMGITRQAAASEAQNFNAVSATESPFADYHLYTFPEPINISNNETKRLTLVEQKEIPVVKKYIFDGQYFAYRPSPSKHKIPLQVKLEFSLGEKSRQPLPAGQVKVYQKDSTHELVLVGEDNISHTATGEKVSIKLGDAFDVLGERTHVSSEVRSDVSSNVGASINTGGSAAGKADRYRLDTYKVAFYNHLNKDIFVTDIEHIQGDITMISSASAKCGKIDSDTFQFEIKVPAAGTAEINYQVKSIIQ